MLTIYTQIQQKNLREKRERERGPRAREREERIGKKILEAKFEEILSRWVLYILNTCNCDHLGRKFGLIGAWNHMELILWEITPRNPNLALETLIVQLHV